jgi:hypothetical protein
MIRIYFRVLIKNEGARIHSDLHFGHFVGAFAEFLTLKT